MSVDPERRALAVERLTALRATGELTTAHVRLVAGGLGVGERAVWRWLERVGQGVVRPDRPGPDSYRLTDTDREAFAYFTGNIAAVARAREAVVSGRVTAAGLPVPEFLVTGWTDAPALTLRTLQRAFRQQMLPGDRAMWREGEDGRRAADVYLTRPPGIRNRVWEMDHKRLPIVVLPPRGPAVTPWLTTIVDNGTRAFVGWAIALTPHTGTVLTAMRMALTPDPARGPFGGIPAGVRIDRGLEFAAEAIKDVFATLCVDSHRLPGFMPYRKGKVERIHLTIDQTMLCGLPGYTEGPRDASGVMFGPVSDRVKARGAAPDEVVRPMRIERFVDLFVGWAYWYNMERPHRMLDGRTPAEAWNEDVSPIHPVAADRLRHLLLAETQRVVGKDGVRFNSLSYVAPELHGRGGERVQVRYMPHDARWIEVYLDDVHLCTAFPQGQLPPGEAEKFRAHGRAEGKRLSADRRRAAARARIELAPMTGGEVDAADSRLIPADQAVLGAGRRADRTLRRRAAADLLGLTDPATPVADPGHGRREALRDRAGADLLGIPDPGADAATDVKPRGYDLLRQRAGTDLLGLTDPTATPPRTS